MELIEVWIEHPVRSLDRTYTYWYDTPLPCGVRVEVSFNHRQLIGFVEEGCHTDQTLEEVEKEKGFELQKIGNVLDGEPLITPELHDLALWMRDETLSSAIACFQAMLPAKIKPAGNRAAVVSEKWVRITQNGAELTPKELLAYEAVANAKEMRYSDLRKEFPNQAHNLVTKGVVELFSRERQAAPSAGTASARPYPLTREQQEAVDAINHSDDEVYLIYGVTGSGKTEVYLELAQQALAEGKQVLFLVPEISLTPQMISRVHSRFGNDLAVYHSALNAQEKYEQYRKVMSGKASIVVGTRSAVFLPFTNLGLIVLDEEQDSSYKQENQPAYHCRDVALFRGRYNHCKVLLGSATPSLESFARARKGVYHLITLSQRVNQQMPAITVVPMKNALRSRDFMISEVLKEKMKAALDQHKQVILLLNRRGYTSILRCRACGQAIICPHCDLAMSWHKSEGLLKCHSCGTVSRLPKVCPSCGASDGFSTFGYGTQRLEEEVQNMFPQARILRMDADTTAYKNSHEKILSSFGRHEADILLGTQMIAKGLDYPDVTLVGILNGDEGLSRSDYRSCEMTFDLLVQAAGRSGRSLDAGEVVYQVFDPDHYAVRAAVKQDYLMFFQSEMQFRHAGMYPPYTYLIALTITGRDAKAVHSASAQLKQHLSGSFKTIGVINLFKLQDLMRDRILLKGRDLDEMRSSVREALREKYPSSVSIRVDVNPMALE